jgi:hypothetical protein
MVDGGCGGSVVIVVINIKFNLNLPISHQTHTHIRTSSIRMNMKKICAYIGAASASIFIGYMTYKTIQCDEKYLKFVKNVTKDQIGRDLNVNKCNNVKKTFDESVILIIDGPTPGRHYSKWICNEKMNSYIHASGQTIKIYYKSVE